MNKLLDFHIRNKYYVKVKGLPNFNGCSAEFPQNIILNINSVIRTYVIDDNAIELFHLECSKDIISKKIHIDKIGIRLLILEDILLQTIGRNISSKLIVSENNVGIFDLLNPNLDKEELELEKELCVCFREVLIGRKSHEVTNHLLDKSYKKILECFEKGGL